jgi:hypothetical protein
MTILEKDGGLFGVWRLAFGVWRSAFSVRRSAFSVRRSAFASPLTSRLSLLRPLNPLLPLFACFAGLMDQRAASSAEGVSAFAGFFRPHPARPSTKT